jgi:acetylglutamate kinase
VKAETLVKFGGELLEQPDRLAAIARVLAQSAQRSRLVVIHGGGREIDAALARAGIAKRQVDGLRVTDAPTMSVVVEVLAGAVNTRFVAAIAAAGGRAVGLTGADGSIAVVERAAPHAAIDGSTVDLGLVGQPVDEGTPALLRDLITDGYLPVVCSIGLGRDGELYNVNADTLAGHLAARLGVRRLVIAGATPGVLDQAGATVPELNRAGAEAMVRSGAASAGMVAKLRACAAALAGGVEEVVMVDGREASTLAALLDAPTGGRMSLPGTRMVA